MFDLNSVLNMTMETPLSTEMIPVPEGEFVGTITKIEARMAKLQSGEVPTVRITWSINDPQVTAITGRETNTVPQDIFLDLTPSGALDTAKGKNVALGRLREAVGQNDGRPWSFNKLQGGVAKVLVTHRTDDEGNVYAQIRRVTALG